MTDALNEALMKLSASRAASREPLPAAVATPAPLSEAVAAPAPLSEAPEAAEPAIAATVEAPEATAIPAPQTAMPHAFAETHLAATSATFKVSSFASASIKRLRELRGWIAAGVALALLVTIWDDLRHSSSKSSGSAPGDATAAVDIDGLLKEFETAEPASAAKYQEPPDTSESAPVPAPAPADGSPVPSPAAAQNGLRFTGRIQPVR